MGPKVVDDVLGYAGRNVVVSGARLGWATPPSRSCLSLGRR